MSKTKARLLVGLAVLEAIVIVVLVITDKRLAIVTTSAVAPIPQSPIRLAIEYESPDHKFERIVKENRDWLSYRPEVDGTSIDVSVLSISALLKKTNYVRILLTQGADLETSVHELREIGDEEAVQLLRQTESELKGSARPSGDWQRSWQYADGQGPSYTYTAGGKLQTRTWARTVNGQPLTTTYAYNNAGDLVSVDYSDSTPDVAHTYDRKRVSSWYWHIWVRSAEFVVMARKLRVEYPGAIYHVMNRGDRREPIFRDEEDRRCFLRTLGEACAKTGGQVFATERTANV
jgi:hypothetical protein